MTENFSERIENALNDIHKIQLLFRKRYGEECLADKEIEEVLKIAKAEHEEIQQYRAIGTVERFQQFAEQFKPHVTDETSCSERHCNKCDKYRKENEKYHSIGTVEECREARERQRAKKPLYKHYEDEGEPPYIKISCPNGCRIQLYPVTEKHLAHEHEFCPKCGQKLDWSE